MNELHDLVQQRQVIVCVGSGGVGKTTTSAVVALHAALSGKRALVLTIDPARRLANSLGLKGIGHQETRVDVEQLLNLDEPVEGELWAMMLDMKSAFDSVVRRNTKGSDEQAERILQNKYYQYFSSSLAGTQEYSAVEQLHEIAHRDDNSNEGQLPRYELIVLDTPPSRHAIDFLHAADRLYDALDSSALQWLYRPALAAGKFGVGFFKLGARYLRRALSRFVGGSMLDDLTTFLESVEPLLNGFKERAGKVREILHNPSTTFLIVTTPDPLTLSEARYLEERLIEEDVNCGGYVVNRVHAPVLKEGEQLPGVEPLTDELREIPGSSYIGRKRLQRLAHQMLRNAKDFDTLGAKDAEMLADLGSRHGAPVFPIPFYSRDIYSLPGLNRVRADLFDDHGRAD